MASNQWGVDVRYFSRELDALKNSLPSRKPDELHRYLLRLAAIVEPAQAQATDHQQLKAEIAAKKRSDVPYGSDYEQGCVSGYNDAIDDILRQLSAV